ncbi:DUF6454 family protein [Luteitalea sp. TBR-22]|uniref:DUF6454 family protein n=1 Tax=Luteitalea sp. TBR-22 TaxID=2802971 RepID=UPI001EF55588|nr:DUF6454 family protein [Luteitalea sp. TBR-22]
MVDLVRVPSRRAFLAAAGLAMPAGLARTSLARTQQVSVRSGTLGTRLRTVPLGATLDHPQGITASADGTTWYVTSVLRKEQKGVLAAFRASDGGLVSRQEVQDGPRYHPGGLGRLGDTLWLPVAEYRRSSTSVVQARDAATLALRTSFAVADHVGAIAPTPSALIGCNWDARLFYEWTFDGRQVRAVEHDGSARYQDLQWLGDTLVAAGLIGDQGVVDLLEWPTLDLRERIVVGATDRGVVLTQEGMAVARNTLLLMPEDDPSRVFVHEWLGPAATEMTLVPPPSTTEPETSLFKKKPTP